MGFFQFITDLFVEKHVQFFNKGTAFMAKGNFLKATYEFKEALKLKPTEEKYHDHLGQSMYKRGMMPEADHAFAIADDLKQSSVNQRDVKVLCRLARAFQEKRMFSVSQNYIQRVLGLDPKNDQAHCLLGRSYHLGNKLKEAVKEYEKAITFNSYCADAYKGLEDIFRVQRKKSKEKEYGELAKYIAIILQTPKKSRAHADLGDAFRKYKRAREAEAEYKESLRLDDKCPIALVGMGSLKFDGGKHDEAKELLLKAVKIDKYNSLPHSYLGLLYKANPRTKKESEWEMALAKQLSVVEKTQDSMKLYQAYVELGDFFYSHKKTNDAEEAYLRGIKSNSKVPEVYVKLGLLYSGLKKAQQAVGYCDQAIKLAPKREIGYIGKGRVLMNLNDFEKAISNLQEALKHSPNNASIHEYLAKAYKKKGLDKLAEKELRVVDSIRSTQEGAV